MSERAKILRERCMARKTNGWPDTSVVTARSLRESEGVESWQVRCGLRTRDRLAAVRFALDDLELLVGRIAPGEHSDAEREAARAYLAQYARPGGQTGHAELDFDPAMALGLDGLRAKIAAQRRDAGDQDAKDALQSFIYALDGLSAMLENAAETAESAMAGASEGRRAEVARMAESCRHVAHDPPESFRDAIQLLWMMTLGVETGDEAHLIGPGHLDRTLRRFYEADIATGTLTRDEARELIEALYLLLNDFIPDGLAIPVMVGGRDSEGCDVTNDISYLCLEALRGVRLVYPTVGICWHEDTPAELIDLGVDIIAEGIANPAFFGDEVIRRGLRDLGVPADESARYINSTCVEITPSGSSNVWVAAPYYNLPKLLLEEISAQAEDAAPTFADFMAAYKGRVSAAVEAGVAQQNAFRRERAAYGGKPLQSAFTRDCIGRARDIDRGGAVYNWAECSFVGLANVADSAHVIREEVYEHGRLSMGELKAVLDADFEGEEVVRLRFLNGYPKYGQDEAAVDAVVGEMVAFVEAECARHTVEPDTSAVVPGAFVWIQHERLGSDTGATPDGRHAGTAFADGAGPAQGREIHGPTAAILSTTSWNHSPLIGGIAFNMKFNAALFRTREGKPGLRHLILTYLRRGGFETQINVVDAQTLKQARIHPEHYRDLVVRIGGYTDYFTRLSTAMQDEIIARTEYNRF